MSLLLRFLAALSLAVLAGCGGPEPVWAPDIEVQRRAHVDPSGPSLALYTVVSAENGSGAHTALMINGSQRVMFDPAGSFRHPHAPERNDVLFGYSDVLDKVYIDYHARETFDVVRQEIAVSPAVAEMALREVQAYGAVPKAQCALAVSRVLARLPGFEGVPVTFFPKRVMAAFAARGAGPGVTITDDDADDNHGVLFRAAEIAARGEGPDPSG